MTPTLTLVFMLITQPFTSVLSYESDQIKMAADEKKKLYIQSAVNQAKE